MMICSEFDEANRIEKLRKRYQNSMEYQMEFIKKYEDTTNMYLNKSIHTKEEKSVTEQIVDNVYNSLKDLSPHITYGDVENKVIECLIRNEAVV